jgi:hypothetical protein
MDWLWKYKFIEILVYIPHYLLENVWKYGILLEFFINFFVIFKQNIWKSNAFFF